MTIQLWSALQPIIIACITSATTLTLSTKTKKHFASFFPDDGNRWFTGPRTHNNISQNAVSASGCTQYVYVWVCIFLHTEPEASLLSAYEKASPSSVQAVERVKARFEKFPAAAVKKRTENKMKTTTQRTNTAKAKGREEFNEKVNVTCCQNATEMISLGKNCSISIALTRISQSDVMPWEPDAERITAQSRWSLVFPMHVIPGRVCVRPKLTLMNYCNHG